MTKPDIYALGTLTSAVSFLVIFAALVAIRLLQRRQAVTVRMPARDWLRGTGSAN